MKMQTKFFNVKTNLDNQIFLLLFWQVAYINKLFLLAYFFLETVI